MDDPARWVMAASALAGLTAVVSLVVSASTLALCRRMARQMDDIERGRHGTVQAGDPPAKGPGQARGGAA